MEYQLHIDLLRCEYCAQHNKLYDFCSTCGRTRTQRIVTPRHTYKQDRPLAFRCLTCFSQRSVGDRCIYCDPGKRLRKPKHTSVSAVPLTLEQEHDAFDVYLRERKKKFGKKPWNYEYGKKLATNYAAPAIVRLRHEAKKAAFAKLFSR